jgi:hypothetical protein
MSTSSKWAPCPISYLAQTEQHTVSFKRFRDIRREFDQVDAHQATADILTDNGSDLTNYLELCDVEDELTTLLKLFNEQLVILDTMIGEYERLALRINKKLLCREPLRDARRKVAGYRTEAQTMINDCRTAQDAVSWLGL